jgi:hypothetical protein
VTEWDIDAVVVNPAGEDRRKQLPGLQGEKHDIFAALRMKIASIGRPRGPESLDANRRDARRCSRATDSLVEKHSQDVERNRR